MPLTLWTAYPLRSAVTCGQCASIEWRGPLLSLIIVLLSLLPWQWRNYERFHDHFFRLTTLEGISLYEAVYPGADGSPKQDVIPVSEAMTEMNEVQRDEEWSHQAWRYIFSAHALRIGGLGICKIGRTWSPWMNAADFQKCAFQTAMIIWHVPLFLFAIVGLWSATIPLRIKGLLVIPLLYFTAVHALFLGSVRYRVPLMPLVCIFTAAGVAATVNRLRKSKPLPTATV